VRFSFDTEIAAGATIEPDVVFAPGARVAAGARIRSFSHLEGCEVGPGAIVGPFARLRPGARIGAEAHIGNFVEVKNVAVGAGAKANHLAYLGDGEVGAGANIGAGTIFCNYDGWFKYRTSVGAGAFIGSNAALVAPVRIGAGAYVGSGSVVTEDVAEDALALGRGRQAEKPGWAASFRKAQSALKASGRKPEGAV
jgi:bifunctional UDP-N-acetylglucosamine pyrophosphorylase/glucosamine-1-phosphate N-acetyltransferase